MATPPYSQTHADAIAAQDALTAAANARFIAAVDIAIDQAVAQGKFRYAPLLDKDVSCKDIADHYNTLGYKVGPANCPFWDTQAAVLFGESWEAYWANRWICLCRKPCRIRISWR